VSATCIRKKTILQWGSKGLFIIKKIQKPNPRSWKANSFVDPVLASLLYQLSRGVTLAYDHCLWRMIDRWKGIIEEIHFGVSILPLAIIENLYLEKTSFRTSKWPRKWKPAKNSKLPKWPENCFEPFGKGGWPPISTWIKPSARRCPTQTIFLRYFFV